MLSGFRLFSQELSMKTIIYMQSGNTKQSNDNGMNRFVYSFGKSYNNGRDFGVREKDGRISTMWTIPRSHSTKFRLELFF